MLLYSPAKINLTLKILGKRPDGFHELETLMCPVSVHETVEIEKTSGGIRLEVVGADLPADPTNLAWRAAEAVREKAGRDLGVHIRLKKEIPMGGGLAGGSGNAAMVLRGVNELWDAGLGHDELCGLAAGLGSDVAFFLNGGPALCTGRGEIVRPVSVEGAKHVVLMHPGFGVPTPWAYKTYASAPAEGSAGRVPLVMVEAGRKTSFFLRNDLEPAVFGKYVWIAEAKDWCLGRPGVTDAMMSGSGATVFALVENAEAAERLAREAGERFGESTWIRTAGLVTAAA